MADFLEELAVLCRARVDVRALTREFLDREGVLASAEIDRDATMRAGHVVVHSQPAEEFRRALVALCEKGPVEGEKRKNG